MARASSAISHAIKNAQRSALAGASAAISHLIKNAGGVTSASGGLAPRGSLTNRNTCSLMSVLAFAGTDVRALTRLGTLGRLVALA